MTHYKKHSMDSVFCSNGYGKPGAEKIARKQVQAERWAFLLDNTTSYICCNVGLTLTYPKGTGSKKRTFPQCGKVQDAHQKKT